MFECVFRLCSKLVLDEEEAGKVDLGAVCVGLICEKMTPAKEN